MCQIQLLRLAGRSRTAAMGLRAFNNEMFARGITSAFLLNASQASVWPLLCASYLPTERTIRFALRGPQEAIDALPDLRGGWHVDLL
jgi:hypothetical protein